MSMEFKTRIKNLRSALLLEKETVLAHYKSAIHNTPITDQIAEHLTLYPVEFLKESYNQFDRIQLDFKIREDQTPDNFTSSGKIALFNTIENEKEDGSIVRVNNEVITIQLDAYQSPEWLRQGKIGIHLLPDVQTLEAQIKTMDLILDNKIPLANQFYNPEKIDYTLTNTFQSKKLNDSQSEAVNQILSEQPFHIVHGPPGTGKTKTLTGAIEAMIQQGKKVVVAAPSNAAVDHITFEISQFHPSVLRIGNSFKIAPKTQAFTLSEKVAKDPLMSVVNRLKKESEQLRKKAFKYKRTFDKSAYEERKKLKAALKEIRTDIRKIEKDITQNCIEEATVITGTFMAIYNAFFEYDSFDVLVVDEAGQALEASIWSIANLAPKIVLAGDRFQLPPTVIEPKSVELGLAKSILESGEACNIPTTLLTIQYRMHQDIMAFSNQYFYRDQLKAANSVAEETLLQDSYKPFEFIDTAGCGFEEVQDETGGIYNEKEGELVRLRIMEIEDTNDIGIISPYRKQVRFLKETLSQLADQCQTIDSFQGQERTVICISLARSNSSGTIGFLSDYRRMNVALTRAKKKLILIGDSATIGTNPFFQKLLDFIESNGTYRSAWEYQL